MLVFLKNHKSRKKIYFICQVFMLHHGYIFKKKIVAIHIKKPNKDILRPPIIDEKIYTIKWNFIFLLRQWYMYFFVVIYVLFY